MQSIVLAVFAAAVCIVGIATMDVWLPYWIDAARGELIILAGFGAGVAVTAGGAQFGALRALLAAVLLTAAIALQYMLVVEIVTYFQRCGPQFRASAHIAAALVEALPAQAACVVLVSAALIFAVSGRLKLRGRLITVGLLLIGLAAAVALLTIPSPGQTPQRCLDW